MKRLIFILLLLVTSAFSEQKVLEWEHDLTEVGTHGYMKADWTKLVGVPADCREGEEQRWDKIVIISEMYGIKPRDLLQGKYLEYFNKECYIGYSGRYPTIDKFSEYVDMELVRLKRGREENGISLFFAIMLIVHALGYFYYKAIVLMTNKLFKK